MISKKKCIFLFLACLLSVLSIFTSCSKEKNQDEEIDIIPYSHTINSFSDFDDEKELIGTSTAGIKLYVSQDLEYVYVGYSSSAILSSGQGSGNQYAYFYFHYYGSSDTYPTSTFDAYVNFANTGRMSIAIGERIDGSNVTTKQRDDGSSWQVYNGSGIAATTRETGSVMLKISKNYFPEETTHVRILTYLIDYSTTYVYGMLDGEIDGTGGGDFYVKKYIELDFTSVDNPNAISNIRNF